MYKFKITNNIDCPFIDQKFDDLLYDSLTILNPKWAENQRMGRWNRDTPRHLYFYEEYGEDGLLVPRGFLDEIKSHLDSRNIKYKIQDKTRLFKEEINFKFQGNLKGYQSIAINKMLPKNIGTLCAPTGSGKTIMGIYMVAERKQPTIIVVHTKDLVYQWTERLKSFLDIQDCQIGKIGDGRLDEDKDITVALIHTLSKYPEIVNQYGYMIIDEVHRCPSRVFLTAAKEFSGRYITGLSATPYRRDGLSQVIEWYAGPIIHKIDPHELIETGDITCIEAVIRKTDFVSCLGDPSSEYSKLLQELSQNETRNRMIVDDILECCDSGEACLVLSDRKAHCSELQRLIGRKDCAVLTGDTGTEERKGIVKKVNSGKIKILIATGQLIGEGFDCKNLSSLFLTLPVRFSGRVIQYIGRVLRPKEGKDRAYVYDYFDKNIRCLYNGFKARQKEYEKLRG